MKKRGWTRCWRRKKLQGNRHPEVLAASAASLEGWKRTQAAILRDAAHARLLRMTAVLRAAAPLRQTAAFIPVFITKN